MFKRMGMVAAAAAFAVVVMPAASEAGSHHKREARSDCVVTKMFERVARHTERAAHSVVHHVRAVRHRSHKR